MGGSKFVSTLTTRQQAAACFFLSCHLCNSHLQLQELQLVNESSAWPDRANLDANAVGGNSDFWMDVYRAYINDEFNMPAIPVQHQFFVDLSTGEVYDILKCKSKWV
jgi:hypothetical protein